MKIFKKNLALVHNILRFGRFGGNLKSIKGDISFDDPTRSLDINADDFELKNYNNILTSLQTQPTGGYTHLPIGDTRERNKRRVTTREELEEDFIRKSLRNLKQLEFEHSFNESGMGTLNVINFTNLDLIQAYPIPQNYILNEITVNCYETYNDLNGTLKLYINDGSDIEIIELTNEDLLQNEKSFYKINHKIINGLELKADYNGIATQGRVRINLHYSGIE